MTTMLARLRDHFACMCSWRRAVVLDEIATEMLRARCQRLVPAGL